MFYGAGVPNEHHDFDPTQLYAKQPNGRIEKGRSRKGSPLEGESGLTPAGKTLPNPFTKDGSGGGRALA